MPNIINEPMIPRARSNIQAMYRCSQRKVSTPHARVPVATISTISGVDWAAWILLCRSTYVEVTCHHQTASRTGREGSGLVDGVFYGHDMLDIQTSSWSMLAKSYDISKW